jgi:hypothetical protein
MFTPLLQKHAEKALQHSIPRVFCSVFENFTQGETPKHANDEQENMHL